MKTSLIVSSVFLCAAPLLADDADLLALLGQKCADCHAEGDTEPTLTAGINLTALRGSEEDVKSILERVERPDGAKGRMPKSKGQPGDPGYVPPLTSEEITLLKGLLAAAAPGQVTGSAPTAPKEPATGDTAAAKPKEQVPVRVFVPMTEEVKLIAEDVEKLPAAQQPFARYLTLTNLANLRDDQGNLLEDERQLDTYRAAISKLVNSLSHEGQISVPVAVDAGRTIYRIDLRHYGWTADEWEQHVVRVYPYALRGVDARREGQIAQATHSQAAWVRADWFTFAASQAPLYLKLLRLPDNDRDLEKTLGIEVNANLQAGRAVRAGFRQSGVSQGNRMIERHEIGKYAGAYWKSYDFSPLERHGRHDLFRSPLGPEGAGLTKSPDREFAHDGGEIIWNLPNGLQAYYLSTSKGTKLDRAPTEIVQDRQRRDGAILNGISCMACHDQGTKYLKVDEYGKETAQLLVDEVGPIALEAGLDRDEANRVRDLYVSQERLIEVMKADELRFQKASEVAMPGFNAAKDPVVVLYKRFKADVKLSTLAAEFGEEDGRFIKRLRDTRDKDLETIAVQLEAGMGFPRASWLDQFKAVAKGLSYELMDFTPLNYTEFTSGAAKAGSNEGQAVLAEGGKLTIRTDKANYVTDDLLTATVKLTEGAFLRLYHLSADKKLTQIFPNSGQPDNFIRGGKEVTLGVQKEAELGAGEFRFRMGKPFGTEIILAVASPVQFTDTENLKFPQGEVFKEFGTEHDLIAASRRGTKGLTVETQDATGKVIGLRSSPVFTARAVFTVADK